MERTDSGLLSKTLRGPTVWLACCLILASPQNLITYFSIKIRQPSHAEGGQVEPGLGGKLVHIKQCFLEQKSITSLITANCIY
jgi:hypothetical protein